MTRTFLDGPLKLTLRIVFVLAIALVIRAILHRIIRQVTERAGDAKLPRMPPVARIRRWAARGPARGAAVGPDVAEPAAIDERRRQRMRALGTILRSASSVVIFTIAGLQILGDLGINLTPLLASASVVGIAVGIGAQSLVRDYLAGVLMLLEDQYGVGDMITIGNVKGTVEAVSLRTTRLRDVSGIVWHIPNGTINQVGNEAQGWSRAVVDYPVPYTADLSQVRTLLDKTAAAMWRDPEWRGVMLEKPDVWGAQDVTNTNVTVRVVARTAPLRQWEVEREMRLRLKAALDAAGIVPEISPGKF